MKAMLLTTILGILAWPAVSTTDPLRRLCRAHRPEPLEQPQYVTALMRGGLPGKPHGSESRAVIAERVLRRFANNRTTELTPEERVELEGSLRQPLATRKNSKILTPSLDPTSEEFSPLLQLRQQIALDFKVLHTPQERAKYISELKEQLRERDINPDLIDNLREDVIDEEELEKISGPLDPEIYKKRASFAERSAQRILSARYHLEMKETCGARFQALAAIQTSPETKKKLQSLANCIHRCTIEAVARVVGEGLVTASGAAMVLKVSPVAAQLAAPIISNPTLFSVGLAVWVTGQTIQEAASFRSCVGSCERISPAREVIRTEPPIKAPESQPREGTQASPPRPAPNPSGAQPSTDSRDTAPPAIDPQTSNPRHGLESEMLFEEAFDAFTNATLRECLPPRPIDREDKSIAPPSDQHSRLKAFVSPLQLQKLTPWTNPKQKLDRIQFRPSAENETGWVDQSAIEKSFHHDQSLRRRWPSLGCPDKRDHLIYGGTVDPLLVTENDLDCLCGSKKTSERVGE